MLTQSTLKSFLDYDPETGIFTRVKVKTTSNSNPGDVAGGSNGRYQTISVDNKRYLSHRLAWLYMTGSFPPVFIDHINGVTDDNRFINLREATHSENLLNQKLQKNNTSGAKGVYWNKQHNNWIAKIGFNGKPHYLGAFKDIEDAKIAVMKGREALHGDFCNHG